MDGKIIITGLVAYAVIDAEMGSVYGVLGDSPRSTRARRLCNDEIKKRLDGAGIPWSWFYITAARSIDANSAEIRYRAELKTPGSE